MIILNKKYYIYLFYILLFYLPFYSFLRGLSIIYLPSFFTLTLNIIRDIIIIFLFIFSINLNKKVIYKIDYINLSIKLLLIINIVAFIITILRGYPNIAIQAFHLSVMPLFMFFVGKEIQNKKHNMYTYFIKYFLRIGLFVSFISIIFYFFRPKIYVNVFNTIYINDYNIGKKHIYM